MYDIKEFDGSLDNSSNMAKSVNDIVGLVSFESKQSTASFAMNEINMLIPSFALTVPSNVLKIGPASEPTKLLVYGSTGRTS